MSSWPTAFTPQAGLEAGYRALETGPALIDRSYRALLEVTGRDRASWLHNLTSNQVKTLGRGEGNYAFALNVQGRILFDLNVLVQAESLWVDLDGRFLAAALKHLNRYIITEDVALKDRSAEFVRLGLAGRDALAILERMGVPHASAMPALGIAESRFGAISLPLIRHDFCGPFAVELFVPSEHAAEVQQGLIRGTVAPPAVPVGEETVQVRRIEAGIPWPGHEITDDVLPAETRQLERAVSYQKGCYLGQEVVERMRSRAVVARQLVGVRIAGPRVPRPGAQLLGEGDKSVGHLTSSCHSMALNGPIALGYVKTASSVVGAELRVVSDDEAFTAVVVELPFSAASSP